MTMGRISAGQMSAKGRYGVNLLSRWEPSMFVGAYLHDHNHKQSLLAPDDGGDFALIVDIKAKAQERAAFANHPCFQALRERLKGDAGGWRLRRPSRSAEEELLPSPTPSSSTCETSSAIPTRSSSGKHGGWKQPMTRSRLS